MRHSILIFTVAFSLLTGCASHRSHTPVAPVAKAEPLTVPTTSPGAKFMVLPAAVQRTITAMGGTAEIRDITKVVGTGQDVYQVQFVNPELNPDLFIAVDGSLVKSNVPVPLSPTGGPSINLPPPVEATLQQQAPNAVVANVLPSQHTIYEVNFVDPNSHPKMLITEEGKVLKEQ